MKSEKLERYCDVISGYAFKSTDWRDSGVPVVKIGNISNGTDIIFDEQIQYVEEEFKNKIDSKYLICKGDILLSLTGSHINQPNSMVGRCCRNRQNKLYFLNQRAGKVIPFSSVDKSYLYYLLSTKEIKYAIANKAYGGANQVNISPRDIKNIRWTFPRLEIQQRIASILSAYDDLIENNNRRIKILEQMAENLYKEWFVRFRFPGYEQAEFENGIPKGWETKRLGDELEVKRGGSPRPIHEYISDTGLKWLKISDATQSDNPYIVNIEESIIEEGLKKTVYLKAGSLVLSNSATPGLPRILTIDSCIHDGWLYFPKKKLSNEYLYLLFNHIRPHLLSKGNGAIFTNLKTDILKRYLFTKPTDIILSLFNDLVKPIFGQIYSLTMKNQNLTKQRDMLLPRLMSGKLEV